LQTGFLGLKKKQRGREGGKEECERFSCVCLSLSLCIHQNNLTCFHENIREGGRERDITKKKSTYRITQQGLRLADGLAFHHPHGELPAGVGTFFLGLGKLGARDALVVKGDVADCENAGRGGREGGEGRSEEWGEDKGREGGRKGRREVEKAGIKGVEGEGRRGEANKWTKTIPIK